ncbi:COX15/CtaA family protein [Paenibacillus pabuli]|uniref:COX15/CtaA family protein n=1 Tax=Paenibacillus pabuli TaxID=1472 RepID=UPI003241DC71
MKHLTLFKWLTVLTCLVMFLATFGGGVVTKTESGLGCGTEWPLCNGKLVPAHTVASLIEYSHRAVSALAGLLSIASFVAFLRYGKSRRDLQLFSFLTLIFVIIQGIMGAFAVVFSQSSAVMALHFGFALIAFASSLMMALGIRQEARHGGLERLNKYPRVSKNFRNLVWFSTIYTYLVVYTGAFVSHTDSAGGCSGFPLCNGQIIPELSGGVAVAFAHRAAAASLVIVIAILGHYAYRKHPDNTELRALGVVSVVLILLQVLIGFGMMLTINRPEVYMFVALAHMLDIAILFGILTYMSFLVYKLHRPADRF